MSLLPSQDNFVKDLPADIPEEERLRILLRLCFKRTLATMANELDGFEDLHRKLLVQGLSMFDSSEDGGNDHLDKLLKLTTSKDDDDTSDVLPAAVAAEHHELLKSLLAECKRWNEMLAEDVHFEPDPPLADHDAAKIPVARQRHYDMLVESAERSRRKAIAILSTLPTVDDEDDDSVAVGDSTAKLFDV